MRLILYLLIFLAFSCDKQQKSIEYYKKKETLTHSDLKHIITVEFNLASGGLKLLNSTDTGVLRKATIINSQIEEWEEVRKKNETVELEKEELDQLESIVSFRQIYIRKMSEALERH